MSIKEALIGVFSDDPINWLKWELYLRFNWRLYYCHSALWESLIPSELGAQAGYCAKQGPCD